KRVDRELRIWSKISHENVLEFLGLCLFWRPNRPLSEGALLSLVSPWMKNGTSTQYLRNNPDVDRLDIVRLCYLSLPRSYHLHSLKVIGAYHGLSHLHSKGIIHGDIKGGNLLISDSGDPVLADFGLAVFAEKDDIISSTTWFSHSDSGLRGTSRWMSPELLNPGASSSYESDVWGFGCLILVRSHQMQQNIQTHSDNS
ncbi:kinase-like protein, partial [Sistotremastrum niveocremeum HHB9708]